MTLAVPTAAITLDNDGSGEVQFEPTSEYATIDNGQLTLDFQGLNADARTNVDDLFEVTVHDDEVHSVWLHHDLDGVTFYVDGDRDDELDRDDPLELDPGESATIGVSVDTADAPTGSQSFLIGIATGDEPDDGVGTPPSDVDGPDDADGDDQDDADDGDEEAEDDGEPGSLEVTSTSIESTSIAPGETAVVSATVTNPGEQRANGTIEFSVGGTVVDAVELELEPGEEQTVSFVWLFEEPGEYAIAVGGVDAGTVTVGERSTISVGERELSSTMSAAIAPPLGAGLLFAASSVRKRRG